ncbi:hypothetical protein [Brevibacillus sp. NRRL NRS-603]|uniref:hypothetical protein n=1 Tax=Brevibacillus TaxID=55080 RepID=UPI001E3B4920|nr:hypothetical protein [Brevibacillus sp. NRRL NRS-603]
MASLSAALPSLVSLAAPPAASLLPRWKTETTYIPAAVIASASVRFAVSTP